MFAKLGEIIAFLLYSMYNVRKETFMGKENDIQWHLGFCAAMELELREYADKLEFHREYPLSRKPLLIDLLVVEKTDDFEITNDIGQIFRKHNIMEYKSENDTLNEDTYFKVMAYAYLYKSSEKHIGDIDINSVTVTFVRERKPEKLLRWFSDNNYKVYEKTRGIYYVEKDGFVKNQVVVTAEVGEKEHIFLKTLKRGLKRSTVDNFLDEAFELHEPFEKDCINSLLGIMVSSNQELFDSIKNGGTGIMNEVLREFFKDEIKANEEQAMKKGIEQGIEQGIERGRIETLYNDCNMSVPDIAKKVSKSEEYVKEIIKKISAACL